MALASVLETVREEDYVEYFLFPPINGNVDADDICLNNYLTQINAIVDRYSKDYLWHKDRFNICQKSAGSHLLDSDNTNSNDVLPSHFYGISHFGDNIEDEWFIVFLLLELTKEIDGLVIRVVDSDGEFLLIEAANFLPAWANPDSCEKRMYLYQGKIHWIPFYQSPNPIVIPDALTSIRDDTIPTETTATIQKSIQDRIVGYPEKIVENLHRTKVYLPVGVAAILNAKPNLIAPAVLAFCNRDPIDMKACRAMKYFPPETRVYTSVQFTKCLYAMLCHSNYQPDRRIGWNLDIKNAEFKAHNLGVKIACGFEILISQAKPGKEIENDKMWLKYVESLKEKNYFKDLLENSNEYTNLLTKAKEYYKEYKNTEYTPVLGREILDLYKKLDHNTEDFNKNESNIPADDDESWLNINPQELDKMLTERYGIPINGCTTSASNLTEKLTEFLDHVSSVDGAEFPQDKLPESSSSSPPPPVRPQRGIKRKEKVSFAKDTKTTTATTENKVNFDPNTFTCAVQNILDLVIPEDSWDLESGSEMSEYGDESELDMDKMEPGRIDTKIKEYMDEMDRELAGTTMGQSFEKKRENGDGFEDIESFKPVDIDMTALKNILESYQSQMGEAGPASNMLGPMGVHLEPSTSSQHHE